MMDKIEDMDKHQNLRWRANQQKLGLSKEGCPIGFRGNIAPMTP